jgi:membrane-associated phospholipid phosphatase
VVVGVVGSSRVILGVHYLLDVFAGVVGGIAVLSALLLAVGPIASRVPRLRGDEKPQSAGFHA